MIHSEKFLKILHTFTSLCLEKYDGVQFMKKTLIFPKWIILAQSRFKNVNCFVLVIHSQDFFKLCMLMRHYSYIKNIEWNFHKYVLYG